MNLYFIRHGDAENASINIKDFERGLTQSGREKMKRAAEGWKKIIPFFDHIITSPLVRAHQTAKIISEVYNYKNDLIIEKRLKSGGTTEDMIEIANYFGEGDIAFIGHQPEFSDHVSRLISNSSASIEFRKGMIAKVSFYNKVKEGKGILELLIPVSAFK